MKERILMRVLFCKIHCPLMCFCKSSASHLYASSLPFKLDDSPHVAACNSSSSDVKVERSNSVLKSCMRKHSVSSKEVRKKRVQWTDNFGEQLTEIKEIESSETGDTDNEEESSRCLCIIL